MDESSTNPLGPTCALKYVGPAVSNHLGYMDLFGVKWGAGVQAEVLVTQADYAVREYPQKFEKTGGSRKLSSVSGKKKGGVTIKKKEATPSDDGIEI